MKSFLINRPEVAEAIAQWLTMDPLVGRSSGVFLAAPRRTGKSTFLRSDLVPLLKSKNYTVIYVDLWADRTSDASNLLKSALRRSLEENASKIEKLRKSSPIEKIGALGFSISFKSPETWDGTLAEGLQLLAASTEQDIVFIIDEAQQAAETEDGTAAMYALKAARDAMNQSPTGQRLYLVMTGSHRDKLAALVLESKSPFYGAKVDTLPPLGLEFSSALAERVNSNLSKDSKLSAKIVDEAFHELGRKPEMILDCLKQYIINDGAQPYDLVLIAKEKREDMELSRRAEILALTKLQQGILLAISKNNERFSPFSNETKEFLKKFNKGNRPAQGAVQKALDVLREKGFVWRSGYGRYAIEVQEVMGAVSSIKE